MCARMFDLEHWTLELGTVAVQVGILVVNHPAAAAFEALDFIGLDGLAGVGPGVL